MIRSSAKALLWAILDAVAHFLYCPTMLGKRHARARWHHRVHLIPASWLGRICDGFDLNLGMGTGEPVAVNNVDGFGCSHVQIWTPNLTGKPTTWCGCDLRPLWRTTANGI